MNTIYIAVHILNIFDWNLLCLTIAITKISPQSRSIFTLRRLDRGFEITYRSSDDASLQIVKYGEYMFDHMILFAPGTKGKAERPSNHTPSGGHLLTIEFGGRLDAETLAQYVDAGGNVLVAGSNVIGTLH